MADTRGSGTAPSNGAPLSLSNLNVFNLPKLKREVILTSSAKPPPVPPQSQEGVGQTRQAAGPTPSPHRTAATPARTVAGGGRCALGAQHHPSAPSPAPTARATPTAKPGTCKKPTRRVPAPAVSGRSSTAAANAAAAAQQEQCFDKQPQPPEREKPDEKPVASQEQTQSLKTLRNGAHGQ